MRRLITILIMVILVVGCASLLPPVDSETTIQAAPQQQTMEPHGTMEFVSYLPNNESYGVFAIKHDGNTCYIVLWNAYSKWNLSDGQVPFCVSGE